MALKHKKTLTDNEALDNLADFLANDTLAASDDEIAERLKEIYANEPQRRLFNLARQKFEFAMKGENVEQSSTTNWSGAKATTSIRHLELPSVGLWGLVAFKLNAGVLRFAALVLLFVICSAGAAFFANRFEDSRPLTSDQSTRLQTPVDQSTQPQTPVENASVPKPAKEFAQAQELAKKPFGYYYVGIIEQGDGDGEMKFVRRSCESPPVLNVCYLPQDKRPILRGTH
jgi:hypothetical protein